MAKTASFALAVLLVFGPFMAAATLIDELRGSWTQIALQETTDH